MSDYISRQAAIEIIKNYCENGCDIAEDNWCPSCQREKFVELLKALPSAQQWIPCSERLPDGRLNKSYLVQDKDGRRAVGTYTNWGWVFGHYMNDPVAWMPLPEPWKEKPNEIH